MVKYFCCLLLALLSCTEMRAAHPDSLFLEQKDGRAYVRHRLLPDETIFSIASVYNVPSIVLAQQNDLSFYESLKGRNALLIPLGAYNYRTVAPSAGQTLYRALYIRRSGAGAAKDWIRYLGISEATWNAWNEAGSAAAWFAGWIDYHEDATATGEKKGAVRVSSDTSGPAGVSRPAQPVAMQDTLPPSDHELMFNYQTDEGNMLDSLSGSVVFFNAQSKVSRNLFAFCNDIPKGRVVKLVNPANNKFVYARILGPMPGTKLYHNARLGVDSRAQRELGIRDTKIWCKIYYK